METTLGCFEFWRAIALIWPILIHNQLPKAWFMPLHIASKLPLPCPPLATIAPTLNVPAATLHPLPTMHRIFTWKQLPQFPCKSHLIYAPSPLLELEVHKRHSSFPPKQSSLFRNCCCLMFLFCRGCFVFCCLLSDSTRDWQQAAGHGQI